MLRKKKFLNGNVSVATQEFSALALQLNQLLHDFVFTRFNRANSRGVAVFLWFAAEMIEARVAATRAFRRIGIDFFEVTEDRINRRVHAVKVHAVKTGRRSF